MARASDVIIVGCISATALMGLLALWMARCAAREARLRKNERTLREELEAYARLNSALAPDESSQALAKRVCATVAQYSAFRQVAMLTRNVEGRLAVTGSAGVDDLMELAINGRVARFAREHRHAAPLSRRHKSCPVTLEPLEAFGAGGTPRNYRRGRQVIILPLWSQTCGMPGALAVWHPGVDDGLLAGKTRKPLPTEASSGHELVALEMLAQKLGHALDFAQMSGRLTQAEKMAGLSTLTGNLVHKLNNPLTAVLGFAELIAETAAEPRVREDAVAIAGEAMRMKDTVNLLFQFWRPSMPSDKAVDVAEMLKETKHRVGAEA